METEVKWRRWLGYYFQSGLRTYATQLCCWQRAGGGAHVCNGCTYICTLHVEDSWGFKKKTCKQQHPQSLPRKVGTGVHFCLMLSPLIFLIRSTRAARFWETGLKLWLRQKHHLQQLDGRFLLRPNTMFLMLSPAAGHEFRRRAPGRTFVCWLLTW